MAGEQRIGRRVYERHLDLLLAEEFACRPSFASWVLSECRRPDDPSLPAGDPTSVEVLVSHDDDIGLDIGMGGENDLLVDARWANGWTARMLIEDKLDAVLQPNQPERYLERARLHQELDEVDYAVAIVVAPAEYLELHRCEMGGLAELSIDAIAGHLRIAATEYPQLSDRLVWRAERLVSLREQRRVSAPDHIPTVKARDWLLERLNDLDPNCEPRGSTLRTINTGWLYFRKPKALIYKVTHGFVDVYLRDIWPDDPAKRAEVYSGADLPAGFEPSEDTVGNLILRANVHNPMPLTEIWGDDGPAREADLLAGVHACCQATRWIRGVSAAMD